MKKNLQIVNHKKKIINNTIDSRMKKTLRKFPQILSECVEDIDN